MRYKCKISYLGKNYSGYQVQENKDTIQGRIEQTLSQVLKQDIKIVASGRTDAGVSALEQVCHFDIDSEINTRRVLSYANTLLPSDIRILDIELANFDFHARFSSKQKTYEYYFYLGVVNPIYACFAQFVGINLNVNAMKEACKYLIGVHDFSSFCASNTSVIDKTREIFNADIESVDENLFKLVITGGGFLYNMVRIIMGTLVMIGQGKADYKDMESIISSKDRSKAGKTMPSKGLLLKKVIY